jgi:2-polyprenyl-3-methyl-5-hydroxy-6-metoxy-1,4-benzoquinol methylase
MAVIDALQAQLQREYVRCALCGSDNTQEMFKVSLKDKTLSSILINGQQVDIDGDETIVKCRECGLQYVNPRWRLEPGMASYSTTHEQEYFAQTYAVRSRAYSHLVRRFSPWLGREAHTLLDVGSGDGVLLEVAQDYGLKVLGLETSQALIVESRKRLGDQAVGSFEIAALPAKQFDVVTLINVIEHLRKPRPMLEAVARVLVPDGIVVLHAPNAGGLPARLHGSKWHQVEPLEHLYYFTARTLGLLLRETGFEPIGRFNISISYGLSRQAQDVLGRLGVYLDNGLGVVARRHSGN